MEKNAKFCCFFGIIRKRYEIRAEYIKKIVDLHKKSLKIYCQIEEKSVKYRKNTCENRIRPEGIKFFELYSFSLLSKEEKNMLRVDYEALAAGSKTLQDQGAIFEECIDRMRQVIEGLPDVWEADTSKRYVEQFQEAEPGLRNVRQMIEDMAIQMQKISDNFAQADSDMAGQM